MTKRTTRRKDRLSKRKVSGRKVSKRRVSRKKNPKRRVSKRRYTKRMKGGAAIGTVPTATGGGWFKCSKGHPFYVGSKGADWANFCPACGEKFKSTIYVS